MTDDRTTQNATNALLKQLKTNKDADSYDRKPLPQMVDNAQTVKDLDYLIEGFENENRMIISDIDRDGNSGYERRLAKYDEQIKRLLKWRAELVERHENGPERMAANLTRIAELKQNKVLLKSKTDVERMLRLVQQITEIEGTAAPEILAANVAHLGSETVVGEFEALGLEQLDPVDLNELIDELEEANDCLEVAFDDRRMEVRARELEEEEQS